jgi:hypothetical protein
MSVLVCQTVEQTKAVMLRLGMPSLRHHAHAFHEGHNQIFGDYLSARGSCTGNGEGTARHTIHHFGPVQLVVAYCHVIDFPPHGFHSRAPYEIKIGRIHVRDVKD